MKTWVKYMFFSFQPDNTRKKAIQNIADQKLLSKIAVKDKSSNIRKLAVEKISVNNQAVA